MRQLRERHFANDSKEKQLDDGIICYIREWWAVGREQWVATGEDGVVADNGGRSFLRRAEQQKQITPRVLAFNV